MIAGIISKSGNLISYYDLGPMAMKCAINLLIKYNLNEIYPSPGHIDIPVNYHVASPRQIAVDNPDILKYVILFSIPGFVQIPRKEIP